jgi:hypothetical protein
MKKIPLQVTLHVKEPSVVELTVGEKVQLDRLTPTQRGHVAERCGDLLTPGITTRSLDQGFYFFKTLSEAHLKVVQGGVDTTVNTPNDKDDWPEADGTPSVPAKGDEAHGHAPRFTVE